MSQISGNYPDVPGPKMAYHRDGTVGFKFTSGPITVLSNGFLQAWNNESDCTWSGSCSEYTTGTGAHWWGLIFPEHRDLVGWFHARTGFFAPSFLGPLQTSPTSTSGVDGVWTTQVASLPDFTATSPAYRTSIQTLVLPGIKGIRLAYGAQAGGTVNPMTFHVYGTITSGEPRYLMFTTTGGTEVPGPHFDFGDDPRGGPVEDKTFKIKNGNASLTANSIVVSCSAPTDKSPSYADDYTFSTGGVFTSTINIGNLGPGASSATLTVRRTTPIGATLGLENPLFSAVAGSWT